MQTDGSRLLLGVDGALAILFVLTDGLKVECEPGSIPYSSTHINDNVQFDFSIGGIFPLSEAPIYIIVYLYANKGSRICITNINNINSSQSCTVAVRVTMKKRVS